MTSLLIIIVLALLAIAIWQLTKIFDLTQAGKTQVATDDSQVANDKDNNIQGYIMFAFLAFIYIFTIYGLLKWGPLTLGTPASEHGSVIDNLFNVSLILIFFVQTVTQFLLYFFSFKYRGRKDQKALYFADSNKLEIVWSTIPAVVLAALIGYGLFAWTDIMFVDEKTEDVMIIELYGQQFNWKARLSGSDNVLGKANVRYIEGINSTGADPSDKYAQDDIVVTELHIPKGQKILFKMRSQDVLHSAYMPHFRAQMNCVPGMVTQFAYKPIFTTDEMREDEKIVAKVSNINKIRNEKSKLLVADGKTALDPYEFDYLLLCNKVCGASHYNMQMKIIVDTPADFKKWAKEQPKFGNQIADEKKEKDSTAVAKSLTIVEQKIALK